MSEENKITLELPVSDYKVFDVEPEASAAETTEVAEVTPETEAFVNQYLELSSLTEEEQQMVTEFSEKIDINDSNIVLQYGAAAQKKIAEFSDNALQGVKTKDLGEVGGMITGLVTELKGFSVAEEEKKGFLGLFKKAGNSLTKMKARFDDAEANVDKITGALETHQNTLMTDIVMLDKMYDSNLSYFKELTMYIIAGKKKLEEERATTLEITMKR